MKAAKNSRQTKTINKRIKSPLPLEGRGLGRGASARSGGAHAIADRKSSEPPAENDEGRNAALAGSTSKTVLRVEVPPATSHPTVLRRLCLHDREMHHRSRRRLPRGNRERRSGGQRYLEQHGWRVIRFMNDEVLDDVHAVAVSLARQLGLELTIRGKVAEEVTMGAAPLPNPLP